MGHSQSTPRYIRITLVNKNIRNEIEGFVKANNYSLVYSIEKNATVEELLSMVNTFRVQSINTLYDDTHICTKQEVLTQDMTLYVSTQ